MKLNVRWTSTWILVALVLAAGCGSRSGAVTVGTASADRPQEDARLHVASLANATWLGDPYLLRPVDPQREIPADYRPADLVALSPEVSVPGYAPLLLRSVAAEALIRMLADARTAGLDVRSRSGFRSYDEQAATFRYWVDLLGERQARRESAVAGHSEHQLGTAIDFATGAVGWELVPEFAKTPEWEWLDANAAEYGFVMSYPDGTEQITGYTYEPWHFRYIGREAAALWRSSGVTLNKFLESLPAN